MNKTPINTTNISVVKDRWKLTFVGGPLNGKTIKYPYLPQPKFGKRSKDTGEQFWYVATEIDEAGGKATMVLG